MFCCGQEPLLAGLVSCLPFCAGVFQPKYCPSVTGCRGAILFGNGNVIHLKDNDIRILVNNTSGGNIWLVRTHLNMFALKQDIGGVTSYCFGIFSFMCSTFSPHVWFLFIKQESYH